MLGAMQEISVPPAVHQGGTPNRSAVKRDGSHYRQVEAAASIFRSSEIREKPPEIDNLPPQPRDQAVEMRVKASVAVEVKPQVLHWGPYSRKPCQWPRGTAMRVQ